MAKRTIQNNRKIQKILNHSSKEVEKDIKIDKLGRLLKKIAEGYAMEKWQKF